MTLNTLEDFVMKFKEIVNDEISAKEKRTIDYKWKIVRRSVIIFIYIHFVCLYGLYLIFFYAKLWTFIWSTYFTFLYYSISS